MKHINNVILIKICNNSTLLILYFNSIINLKQIYAYRTFKKLNKPIIIQKKYNN